MLFLSSGTNNCEFEIKSYRLTFLGRVCMICDLNFMFNILSCGNGPAAGCARVCWLEDPGGAASAGLPRPLDSIPYTSVRSKTWRKHFAFNNRML